MLKETIGQNLKNNTYPQSKHSQQLKNKQKLCICYYFSNFNYIRITSAQKLI